VTSLGGGALLSVRDYEPNQSGTKIVPYGVRRAGDRRYIVFQVWEYRGPIYDLSMYFVDDAGGSQCETTTMRTTYYAIPISRLVDLMTEAGFQGVRRIDDRFFQPLVAGFRPQQA
jgi:hypothetical protein